MASVENTLAEWLAAELEERGWSVREVARRGGVSHTAINNALSELVQPTLDTYKAIALAFGISLEDVLRRAGELPPLPPAADGEEEVLYLYRQLTAQQRDTIRLALRGLALADRSSSHLPTPVEVERVAPSGPAPRVPACPFASWDSDNPPSAHEKLSQLWALADDEYKRYIVRVIVGARREQDRQQEADRGEETVRGGAVEANGQ